MKKLLVFILLGFALARLYGQDNIIKTDGTEIKAKVLAIRENSVEYKRFESIDGPSYEMLKKDIFMIQYENGTTELFSKYPSEQLTDDYKLTNLPKKEYSVFIGSGLRPPLSIYADGMVKRFHPTFGFEFVRKGSENIPGFFSWGFKFSSFGLETFWISDDYNYDLGWGFSIYSKYFFCENGNNTFGPYAIVAAGIGIHEWGRNDGNNWVDGDYDARGLFWGGVGLGTNIRFSEKLSSFIEFGYFTYSVVNIGLNLNFKKF